MSSNKPDVLSRIVNVSTKLLTEKLSGGQLPPAPIENLFRFLIIVEFIFEHSIDILFKMWGKSCFLFRKHNYELSMNYSKQDIVFASNGRDSYGTLPLFLTSLLSSKSSSYSFLLPLLSHTAAPIKKWTMNTQKRNVLLDIIFMTACFRSLQGWTRCRGFLVLCIT